MQSTPSVRLAHMDETAAAALGARIGASLFPGAFIALFGGLGAGKTTLTRHIAAAIGVYDIMSPTFTVVREHRGGKYPLFHFDAYRLSCSDELMCIGFMDYVNENGIIIMEWCENVPGILPQSRLEIRIEGSGDFSREIIISGYGDEYAQMFKSIEEIEPL